MQWLARFCALSSWQPCWDQLSFPGNSVINVNIWALFGSYLLSSGFSLVKNAWSTFYLDSLWVAGLIWSKTFHVLVVSASTRDVWSLSDVQHWLIPTPCCRLKIHNIDEIYADFRILLYVVSRLLFVVRLRFQKLLRFWLRIDYPMVRAVAAAVLLFCDRGLINLRFRMIFSYLLSGNVAVIGNFRQTIPQAGSDDLKVWFILSFLLQSLLCRTGGNVRSMWFSSAVLVVRN